jgi:hypothetical protein
VPAPPFNFATTMTSTVELRIALSRHIRQADLLSVGRFLQAHRNGLAAVLDAGGDGLEPALVQAAGRPRHAMAMVVQLLEAGAPVDRPDADGETALFRALSLRHLPVAQRLLDAGASPHAANAHGVRVFDKVLATGDMAWVRRFLDDGHRLDAVSRDGDTCLHWAARSNNPALYDLVRERTGLRPDQPTRGGRRPVDLVTSAALLAHMRRPHGADMRWNVVFENRDHSLHAYAGNGAADIVRELLAHGVAPNVPGEHRDSPLHRAVASRSLATVQALLAGGAKVNVHNAAGAAPLHWAAELGLPDIVHCLLANKARVDARVSVRAPLEG